MYLPQKDLRENIERLEKLAIQEQYRLLMSLSEKDLDLHTALIDSMYADRFMILVRRAKNLICVRCQHHGSHHGSKCGACGCNEFAADNLTYIEQEANKITIDK